MPITNNSLCCSWQTLLEKNRQRNASGAPTVALLDRDQERETVRDHRQCPRFLGSSCSSPSTALAPNMPRDGPLATTRKTPSRYNRWIAALSQETMKINEEAMCMHPYVGWVYACVCNEEKKRNCNTWIHTNNHNFPQESNRHSVHNSTTLHN